MPEAWGTPPTATRPGRGAGCWIAALLGCVGLLAMVGVGAVAAAWFFVRHAAPPSPVATAPVTPPEDDPTPPEEQPLLPADPDVHVETKQEPYSVQGASADELRRQMNTLGPSDAEGRHDAYTRWYVRWKYPFDRSDQSCGLGAVRVDVTVTYVMPEWSAPPDAPPELVTRWNRYRASLQKHEDGHRDNGVAAGNEVLKKLRTLGTASSCNDIDRDANQLGNRVVNEFKQKDASYDKSTRHGATQGAVFP